MSNRNVTTSLRRSCAVALATVLFSPALALASTATDAAIRTLVENRLARHRLDEVGVQVTEGDVELDGQVPTLADKELAGELASRLDEVATVDNRLQVQSADALDSEVAAGVRKALSGYYEEGVFDWVQAAVNGHDVTLTGWVYLPWNREIVATRVAKVPGVQSVDNRIQVLPSSGFDDQIRHEAFRRIYLNPEFRDYLFTSDPPIHIIVRGGRVTLEGVVRNRPERLMAQSLLIGSLIPFPVTNDLQVGGSMPS